MEKQTRFIRSVLWVLQLITCSWYSAVREWLSWCPPVFLQCNWRSLKLMTSSFTSSGPRRIFVPQPSVPIGGSVTLSGCPSISPSVQKLCLHDISEHRQWISRKFSPKVNRLGFEGRADAQLSLNGFPDFHVIYILCQGLMSWLGFQVVGSRSRSHQCHMFERVIAADGSIDIDSKGVNKATELNWTELNSNTLMYTHGITYQPTVLTFQIYAVFNADSIHRC